MTKAQKCPALAIPSGWYIMNNNADRGLGDRTGGVRMEFFWEMLSLQETMFLLILTGVLIKS